MSRLTPEEVYASWKVFHDEAEAAKDSMRATQRFSDFYRRLDSDNRRVVDQVAADWVLDDPDSPRRYDALSLISTYRITSTLAVLRESLASLEDADGPGAPFHKSKLERLIAKLEEQDSDS